MATVQNNSSVQINPFNTLKDGSPSMAKLLDGTVVSVFQSEIQSGGFEVQFRFLDQTGSPTGDAVGLGTSTALRGGDARVSSLSDDTFVVMWRTADAVVAQRFHISGDMLSPVFVVVERPARREDQWSIDDYDIFANASGGFSVLYTVDHRSDDGEDIHDLSLHQVTFATNSSTLGSDTDLQSEHFPKFGSAVLSDGRTVVISQNLFEIYDGATLEQSEFFTPVGFQAFSDPVVTALTGGGFVIAGSSGDNVVFRVFSAAVTLTDWDQTFEIANSFRLGTQSQPSITALSNGGFILVWKTNRDGTDTNVEGQVFDATGAPVGGGFDTILAATGTQGKVSAIERADGTIQLIWQSDETGDLDVRAERFTLGELTQGVYTITDDQPATGGVTLSDSAEQGTEITATSTIDDPDGVVSTTLEWFRGPSSASAFAQEIFGETNTTYTPGQSDVGSFLGVRISVTDTLGETSLFEAVTKSAVANVNDVPIGPLDVQGSAVLGGILTAVQNFTDADGIGNVSLQWYRDGRAILGATDAQYKVTSADLGKQLFVRGFYVDGFGTSEIVDSLPVGWAPTEDADFIGGTLQADSLLGLGGDDTLFGHDGDDTLNGGDGADLMRGGDGSDFYFVDNVGDGIVESRAWSGHDIVQSSVDFRMGRSHIEDLRLTGSAQIGAGNGLANEIRGTAGNNILDGGKNNDTLMGGAGHDTYFVRAPGDTVVEAAARGIDTVKAFRSYLLEANVERLFMQTVYTKDNDPAIFNGIGNTLDNTIVGTPFSNTIVGREGNDVLKGQAGADTFVFDRGLGPNNIDRIIDFNVNEADEGDMLYLKSSVFGGLATGALEAESFALGTTATRGSDRLIFDQSSGHLWFDADGLGGGAQVLVARFEQNATIESNDIFIF
jgi:hypothetical protein